jgi:hypothetical protein
LGLHLLVGVFGVLVAILIERRRTRADDPPAARGGRLTDAERAQRVAPPKRTTPRVAGEPRRD